MLRIKNQHLRSVFFNIPRIWSEFSQARSVHEKYLFFYFNLPYLFPAAKFPAKITLEFNNYCNFQCTHCHRYVANANRPKLELDFDLFKKIISGMCQHPATILKIGGWGEPSLHPQFHKMLKYSSERNVRTYIFTNGTIFKKCTFEELLQMARTVLVISVDGFDEKSYEKIRIGGQYRELQKDISDFFQFRNRKQNEFPKIVVQRVVFPDESDEDLQDFRKLWSQCTDAVDFCIYNSLEKALNPADSVKSPKRCKRIRRELSIMCDGKVPICGPQTKFSDCEYVGDVNTSKIHEIWNGQRISRIRKLLARREFEELRRCEKCIYFR